MVRGRDALTQRALVSLAAHKGRFIYNRALGSELGAMEEPDAARAQQLAGEALAQYGNTAARVTDFTGGVLRLALTIEGETEIREVRIHGSV